jgi:hypothetical protein
MNDTDIIMRIVNYINLNAKDGKILISPAKLEDELEIPKGSVLENIEAVLKKVNMKIAEQGETDISLRIRHTEWRSFS